MTARSRLTGEPCARSVPRGPVRSRRVITDVADDLRPGRLEHLAIALPDGGQHGFTVQSSRSPLQHRAEKRIITSAYTSVAKSVASTVDEKLSPARERLRFVQTDLGPDHFPPMGSTEITRAPSGNTIPGLRSAGSCESESNEAAADKGCREFSPESSGAA